MQGQSTEIASLDKVEILQDAVLYILSQGERSPCMCMARRVVSRRVCSVRCCVPGLAWASNGTWRREHRKQGKQIV